MDECDDQRLCPAGCRRLHCIAAAMALAALFLTACSGGNTRAIAPAAQITTTSVVAEPPPSTFVAADAHFKAVFPVEPTRTSSTRTVGGVVEPVIAYEGDSTTEKLDVGYLPLPGRPDAVSVGPALDAGVSSGAASDQGTVTFRQRIIYLGGPAEDATFQSPFGTFHERMVLIGQVFYIIKGLTPIPSAPHPQYDTLLATFQLI